MIGFINSCSRGWILSPVGAVAGDEPSLKLLVNQPTITIVDQ